MLFAIKTRTQSMRGDTLLMNAVYLMLSTFVVAATGFVFWAVVTRTYDAAVVGLATTLLSVSGLLSLLGLAGFDTTLVRFLPHSTHKNDYINSGFVVVTVASALLAVVLGLLLPIVSPSLAVLSSPGPFIAFIFFTVVTALNVLTNAVFLAFKQAKRILVINSWFSMLKVILPLLALGGGATTIFVLAGCTQLLGLVLSVIWMKRKLDYKFAFRLSMDTLRAVRKFSFAVYISSVLNLLPPTLLPLIILYHLGPSKAAYYYMAFTIASVLYTVAYASMQSVFAEGSHDETAIRSHIVKAVRLIAILLLPAMVVTVMASSLLMGVFGQEYATSAAGLLQLFALSALPVAIYSALGAIFKIAKHLRSVVSMNIVYASAILSLSYLLMPRYGIIAVGWAWLVGNVLAAGIGIRMLMNEKSLFMSFSARNLPRSRTDAEGIMARDHGKWPNK